MQITIDERTIEIVAPGQNILEICRSAQIELPTLCHDARLAAHGGCGLCVVEVQGRPKLQKACATLAEDGMVIFTNNERVRHSRRVNLELLLSNHSGDCQAPCRRACPAGTNCQSYLNLAASGKWDEAIAVIKDKLPLPAVLGRVCPHPCEAECRRAQVEEPLAIAWVKRCAADLDLAADTPWLPPLPAPSGKRVAVVGGGAYGLSVAYFLRRHGHAVTLFESMPQPGGMLRYGIPEYRLPKEVLDREIAQIAAMGVQFVLSTHVGRDLRFETLQAQYDAICVGVGAWQSTRLHCPGEDLDGVMGGIDFLRCTVAGCPPELSGKHVVVVGGGNTAMDAARTAVRLGADRVSVVYRRAKEDMPADPLEVQEAEDEGVHFEVLNTPIEFIGNAAGDVTSVVLQRMSLSRPDANGRRSPQPQEGQTHTMEAHMVLLAIGQAVEPQGFAGVSRTRRQGLLYDPATHMTNLPGVFAGGDCGNDKISVAVEAVADAQRSAQAVDLYLRNEPVVLPAPYLHAKPTPQDFSARERMFRQAMTQLPPQQRNTNFNECLQGYAPDEAMAEAERCLACGCTAYESSKPCKLLRYAQEHNVTPERFAGEKPVFAKDESHPLLQRDPNKCIHCGLCVRLCETIVKITALGVSHRGFQTIIEPAFGDSLAHSPCNGCGECAKACPTGALVYKPKR